MLTSVHRRERGHFVLVIMELEEIRFISLEHKTDKGVVGTLLVQSPSFLENVLWISGQELDNSNKGVGSLLPTE